MENPVAAIAMAYDIRDTPIDNYTEFVASVNRS